MFHFNELLRLNQKSEVDKKINAGKDKRNVDKAEFSTLRPPL
jgi:hypothetical protein